MNLHLDYITVTGFFRSKEYSAFLESLPRLNDRALSLLTCTVVTPNVKARCDEVALHEQVDYFEPV
jgi:hypothetical protein